MQETITGILGLIKADGSSEALPNINILAQSEDGRLSQQAVSDIGGRFELSVSPGRWLVTFEDNSKLLDGRKAILIDRLSAWPVDVTKNEQHQLARTPVYAAVSAAASLAGWVYCTIKSATGVEETRVGLPDVKLSLVRKDGKEQQFEAMTDANGVFVFEDVEQGEYSLQPVEQRLTELKGADVPRCVLLVDEPADVELKANTPVFREFAYRVLQKTTVSGQVLLRDTEKKPLEGIVITLRSEGETEKRSEVTTNSDGRFEITVFEGKYRLEPQSEYKVGDTVYVADTAKGLLLAVEEGQTLEVRPIFFAPPMQESYHKRIARFIANLLTRRRAMDWVLLFASMFITLVLFMALAWVCWFKGFDLVIDWGFVKFEHWYDYWRTPLAAIAIFYIAIAPMIALPVFKWLLDVWDEYFNQTLSQEIHSARNAQKAIEEELLKKDPDQIVKVVAYSRETLREYYTIGREQAQRSFRNSLIAMWLGFLILLIGVVDSVVPMHEIIIATIEQQETVKEAKVVDAVPSKEARTAVAQQVQGDEVKKQESAAAAADAAKAGQAEPGAKAGLADAIKAAAAVAQDRGGATINNLVLMTGAVIEFIAAIFLWMYRSSLRQLNLFYGKQLRFHGELMAQRLARNMGDKKDEATRAVIDMLFEEHSQTEIEAPSGKGIGQFFKGGSK